MQMGSNGPLAKVMTAANDLVTIDVSDFTYVGLQITGTWAGTMSFTGSLDGSTFVALNLLPSNSVTPASSATANGCFSQLVGGYKVIRAQWTTATSGSPTVTLWAS